MATGRFDLAFLDDGAVVAGQQWSIELTFQGPPACRWCASSGLVGGEPGGRVAERSWPCSVWLARLAGTDFRSGSAPIRPRCPSTARSWRTAKGRTARWSPSGWRARRRRKPAPPKGLAGHFDDLQLIRFAEPPASLELDITQDEARLVVGDQLYGESGKPTASG